MADGDALVGSLGTLLVAGAVLGMMNNNQNRRPMYQARPTRPVYRKAKPIYTPKAKPIKAKAKRQEANWLY